MSGITNFEGIRIAIEILLGVLGFCLVTLFKRMSDDIKSACGDIKTLAVSVQTLNVSMAQVVTTQGDHGRRIGRLEELDQQY